MPTAGFSFWPFPPVSCFSESRAALQTSRRVSCAEPKLSLEGVEYEANHCRSSLHLHTRGGGYRRWTLPSCTPISGGGGKPIDRFAARPAAETDTGRFAMPAATAVACGARGRRIESNQIRCFAGCRDLSCRTCSAALPRRQALLERYGAISLMTGVWLRGGDTTGAMSRSGGRVHCSPARQTRWQKINSATATIASTTA